jgi:hypothetical protein
MVHYGGLLTAPSHVQGKVEKRGACTELQELPDARCPSTVLMTGLSGLELSGYVTRLPGGSAPPDKRRQLLVSILLFYRNEFSPIPF